MIGSTRQVRVFVHKEPVDMRKAFDTLSALVTQCMGQELLSGNVFLFVGKNRRRAKALMWDGTGLCLYSKRLSKGRFAAPWMRSTPGPLLLTMTELSLFFEGSELALRVALSPEPWTANDDVLRFG